jgi:hypothetical protein
MVMRSRILRHGRLIKHHISRGSIHENYSNQLSDSLMEYFAVLKAFNVFIHLPKTHLIKSGHFATAKSLLGLTFLLVEACLETLKPHALISCFVVNLGVNSSLYFEHNGVIFCRHIFIFYYSIKSILMKLLFGSC